MLELLPIEIDNAVAFRVTGKITEQDMTLVLNSAKAKITEYGEIVLLEEIVSFEGVEVGALIEKFKYLVDMGISNISKIAVVTDKVWIEKILAIENKLLTQIDLRCFSSDQYADAVCFLRK